MGSPLGNCKDIPGEHHVARYCRPKHVQGDRISAQAFELRRDKGEKYLSANWMEYFELNDVRRQLECVREAMLQMNFRPRSNGRFARLNVGKIKNSIDNLQVKSIPSPKNPSHAGIYSTDVDQDGSIAVELKNSVQPDDIFPAV